MIGRVRSRWGCVVLVCGKCEKKLKGGFGPGGDQRLSKLLRKRAGGKGRKAAFGVVSTGCLKLCPKGAVTIVDGARPAEWLVVAARTPNTEVVAALGLNDPSRHAELVSASTVGLTMSKGRARSRLAKSFPVVDPETSSG